MSKRLIDTYATHELMDRTSLISNMIESFLLEHFATDSFDDFKKEVEAAADHLGNAYQLIGEIHFNKKSSQKEN